MAKNYERMDYTYLLDELQGNTARAIEPISSILQVYETEGKTENSVNEQDMSSYEDSLIVVGEMIQHVIKPYDMYLPHVENVLDLFKMLEGRNIKNAKKIEKMMGLPNKKERSRIITWLKEIKVAIKEFREDDVEFFCQRLCEMTGFCTYVNNFTGKEPFEVVIDHTDEPKDKKPESAKLHRILSDEKIKYVYSDRTLKIHDKSCPHVRLMEDDEIHPVSEYLQGFVACPVCELKAYIRAGAQDIKDYEKYVSLFKLMGADKDIIKRMYIGLGVKTKISNMNTEGYKYSNMHDKAIMIWYRDDKWRIGLTDKHMVRLEHNNYKRIKNGGREFVPGFHIQNDRTISTDIKSALDVIRDYRYTDHVVLAAERQKQKSKNIPEFHKYQPKEISTSTVEVKLTLKERIAIFLRRTIFRDRIRNAREVDEKSLPKDNQICLYLWESEKGDRYWSAGKYTQKQRHFSVSYENQKVLTPIEKVIKWVPLNELNAR